ncbi:MULTISPECIES: hypothetical protein [Treponema]|uniref:Tetratricopeptide repeat protein n=1 Tax=Treponema rectale TaxID=744512 RepID=A0A840SBB6_9SPIR|nr:MULTISPECIES: hypothetical protein [Treponema]MBB5218085.1 hypothetical protein [Treponema rectale]MBE6354579.1 hypothetical protein [Treponema sp.]MBO6176594.1 hypothetical protein [Treponema sp.]QOS40201.1 hypothetical protein DYE49_06950 [Treponema rectale]
MARSAVERARALLKRRKFSLAITLLESYEEYYRDDFEFNLVMGHAFLYSGDFGSASSFYKRARNIRINDSELILGQAAIFLQRGDTQKAIEYYLDVLDIDPENAVAKAALDFIRDYGEYPVIVRWYETGKLQRFFPPLGLNPLIIIKSCAAGILAGIVLGAVIYGFASVKPARDYIKGPRMNLSSLGLELSSDERESALAQDLSGTVVHFMLSRQEANRAYDDAVMYFQDGRDNACRVEINRLLQSNVSAEFKGKVNVLESLLFPEPPTFDNLLDNVSYDTIVSSKVPELYEGCYVAWSGRISRAELHDNGDWSCTLLVGYENLENFDGYVQVNFSKGLNPVPDGKKAVRFLGRVKFDDGKLKLDGISVYQPLKDGVLKN